MKNIAAILASEAKQVEASKKKQYWTHRNPKPAALKIAERKERRKKRRDHYGAALRFYTLYALKCEHNTYYVGMTAYRDPLRRMLEHVEGGVRGAQWTKLHKPIDLLETRQVGYMKTGDCAKLENDMTVEYILEYGIDNVRGGDMCSITTERNIKNYERHLKNLKL